MAAASEVTKHPRPTTFADEPGTVEDSLRLGRDPTGLELLREHEVDSMVRAPRGTRVGALGGVAHCHHVVAVPLVPKVGIPNFAMLEPRIAALGPRTGCDGDGCDPR